MSLDQQQQQQLPTNDEMFLQHEINKAAKLIQNAKYIIYTSGAGLGVDSGLPAFRTKDGLWRAYPAFEKIGISNLSEMSNPEWFERDPALAWGFWSHRTSLYRRTKPHAGFDLMLKWAKEKASSSSTNPQENCFVFTSNVDGQFQRSGFDDERVHACHGEVTLLQCTDYECAQKNGTFPWPKEFLSRDPIVDFDESTLRVKNLEQDVPVCIFCRDNKNKRVLARPNVLMFGDGIWTDKFQETKMHNLGAFMAKTRPSETVVVEIGAGTAIPTVRQFSESLAKRQCACIRINKDESHFPSRLEKDPDTTLVSLPLGGLEALKRIDEAMKKEE